VGHSHGGLFGLYTLFHHPDTFRRYVIGSPSIHYDGCVILAHEREYAAAHQELAARVFLCAGAREESDDPLIQPECRFVSNVQLLAQILEGRRYPGLQLTTHIFDEESHVSVIPRVVSSGLRSVFG
jgi:predicted alpha/beta superfamily hydrolase